MTIRFFIFNCLLTAVLLLAGFSAQAQTGKIPRIGYLTGTREPTRDAPDANRDAFRRGLRDLGYVEGKNLQVEYRYSAGVGERAASLVAELLHLKVDVIVSPVALESSQPSRPPKRSPL